jgi:hypothetical protein
LRSNLYQVLLLLQVAFYLWGVLGLVFLKHLRTVRFALIGYFLLAMNAAFLVGFIRSIGSRGGVTWRRVS